MSTVVTNDSAPPLFEDNDDEDSDDEDVGLGYLPPFVPCCTTPFRWGHGDGDVVARQIDEAYEEMVKWRKNI